MHPTDTTMEADESKLSVVIDSMLSNAVNYSKPPRKIRVAYQFSNAEQMHKISIQDNGVGITNSQLDEIFEPFTLPEQRQHRCGNPTGSGSRSPLQRNTCRCTGVSSAWTPS